MTKRKAHNSEDTAIDLSKLRVLQLGKFYPIRGGVEKVMYNLMEGLSERGIRCDMLCAMEQGGDCELSIGEHAKLIGCRTVAKWAGTMLSVSMVRRLCAICGDYDIIHVHHPDPMAALALRLSGYKGKVVLHWHSDIVRQRALLSLYSGLQRWLIRRADVIVGTTEKYVRESEHLRGSEGKLTWMPIGIRPMEADAEGAARLRSQHEGKKVIFSLGRLVEYKGYEHLIDAAALLGDGYMVLIGGEGPLRDKLQQKIDALGLDDKVKLAGRIPDEELPSYFGACDIFVLSSVTRNEAFAIVQAEAMSMGKPVVATRIPGSGVPWVNSHGESGLNVEPGNPRELAEAIRSILDDPAETARYQKGARERYERWFTHERMIDNAIDIYSALLEKGRHKTKQNETINNNNY